MRRHDARVERVNSRVGSEVKAPLVIYRDKSDYDTAGLPTHFTRAEFGRQPERYPEAALAEMVAERTDRYGAPQVIEVRFHDPHKGGSDADTTGGSLAR